MKYIILFLLFPVLLFSQDASAVRKSSPEMNLREESLNQKEVDAFLLRAEQKVNDFMDGVSLISDASIDEELRAHVMANCLKLFVADSTRLVLTNTLGEQESMMIKNYLKNLLDNPAKIEINTSDIKYSGDKRLHESVNKWQLNLVQLEQMAQYPEKKYQVEIEIYLKRIKKKFGKRYIETWETFIGDIVKKEMKKN